MTHDPTETARRELAFDINFVQGDRAYLEEKHGQVWDTSQLQRDFQVAAFMAPFVLVTRKSDNVQGTLLFQHSPRYYFAFQAG